MKVRVSASLLESGGRPVVRSIERAVWPADTLIAVRPQFDGDVARERARRVRSGARDVGRREGSAGPGPDAPVPRGTPVLLALRRPARLEQRLYRNRGTAGFARHRAERSRPADRQRQVGPLSPEISDPETGETMRYRFYAGWNAQDADAMGNRPDRVQMKLEGVPAKPGDSVKLTLTPPHDGQALVMVEGDRMLWSTWVSVKATGTQVEIPIDKAWKRHDLYVSAAVFRPGSEGDRVTPARALGLTYLPIASADRKLDVKITAPAKSVPETRPASASRWTAPRQAGHGHAVGGGRRHPEHQPVRHAQPAGLLLRQAPLRARTAGHVRQAHREDGRHQAS